MCLISSISELITGKIKINSIISIGGWVRNRRHSKIGISFINLYDGSHINDIQIIANSTLNNYKNEILSITCGCSLSVTGKLKISLNKNMQNYEIYATKIKILGWVKNPGKYPISSKKHSLKYLREVSHLRSRTTIISCITRIRHNMALFIHNFLHKKNFFWINTPLITTLDTEGSSKMFRVSTLDLKNFKYKKNVNIFKKDFFGKESFLTVSGQLNLETYACSMSKVYTFGPTFRAENSNTKRHLAEFWMLELEIAFISLKSLMIFAEKMLKKIFEYFLNFHKNEIIFLSNKTKKNLFNKIE
ncbi:amino acid--tRNA ligase-related protein, partial [Enterobacteriaceae endosymbiont of Donacia piscatrix]|uniref:amino acid--tRNA ligase-related protein n=1 Tax=Enterobacteriaceae endosymbiont of Donacia piscatrix TaxID=2675780 RepID=UPI001FFD9CAC